MMSTRSQQHRNPTLLDEFSQSLRSFLGVDNPQHLVGPRDEWRPPADIRQSATCYVLEIELPGFGRDKIKVELANEELSVHCERTERDGDDKIIRRERHLGGFVRHFRLPEDALQREVSARMDSGVLFIRVPRKSPTDMRSIDVS